MISGKSKLRVSEIEKTEYLNFRHFLMAFDAVQRENVIVFICNWNAYRGLEAAGRARQQYPANLRAVRVPCLGRIHPGLVLKAFEHGAAGVLMLGCPPEECHHDFGYRQAQSTLSLSRELMRLLGFRDEQLQLATVTSGDGSSFAEKVLRFVDGLNGGLVEPI
jgi:F420-non-reducing hydrogenase iron-sulfur subunit